MFMQVITGQTTDSAGLRRQLDRWRTELKPTAIGFVGSTVGIADDGSFVALARFRDADAARQNAERPEQGAWWEETAKYFDDEPIFRESTDIATVFGGGSDSAGFVQVMQGTVTDRARAEAAETEVLEQLREARPDLLGSLRVWFDGGSYLEAAYFTSESDARTGETSAEFSVANAEFMELFGQPTFTDLRDPLLD